MKTKIYFAAIFFFLCITVFPVMAQQSDTVSPPSWIEGTWTYTESLYVGDEGPEGVFSISFTASDIIFDEGSLNGFISSGEVTMFTQKAELSSYETYIEYFDGYWYREKFEKTAAGTAVMRSVYETSEGESGECIYTRQ